LNPVVAPQITILPNFFARKTLVGTSCCPTLLEDDVHVVSAGQLADAFAEPLARFHARLQRSGVSGACT